MTKICFKEHDGTEHLVDAKDGLSVMRAAIENGELQVIQLHDGVVDAATDQGGEQVLGGGNQHALFHQTGGIADPGYILAHGLHFKAVQISSAEDYA